MGVHYFIVLGLFGALVPEVSALMGTVAAPPPISTVKLQKQYVPIKRGDRVVAHKTAFFGTVHVGAPSAQTFTVVFDTGSGHVFVPTKECKSEACSTHRQYDRQQSSSAIDIDYDGVAIDPKVDERDQVALAFGTGEIAGEFVKEVVCLDRGAKSRAEALKRPDCVGLRLIMAVEMTPDPFASFAFDGVIGLGLGALSLHEEFNFFGQMSKQGLIAQPRFGVFLAQNDDDDSEIAFGGHDERRVSSPLRWAPVHSPELGHWQLRIKSVRVGNETVSLCEGKSCYTIVDSGTSLLGVPKQITSNLHHMMARQLSKDDDLSTTDCRKVSGPPIVFEMDDFSVQLEAEDYSRPAPMHVQSEDGSEMYGFCRASLLPVAMEEPLSKNLFIWGEPMLRKYYTAYDWQMKQIGFAEPRQPSKAAASFVDPVVTV